MKRSTYVFAAVSGTCLALSLTLATSLVRAQESASAGYKIGVVDMVTVFQKYDKREEQFQELLDKRQEAQDRVDALAAKINEKQDKYKSMELTASEDELESLMLEILSDRSELQAEQTKLQSDVSRVEDQKLRALNEDIRMAIAEIGQAEKYHLILESGSQGTSGVLYSATPLNLTSKVIEKLNK